MQMVRARLTVRLLMVTVAVIAIMLTIGRAMRPQPVQVQIRGMDTWVRWSDGSEQKLKPGAKHPNLDGGKRCMWGFLVRVKWIDMDDPTRVSYTWHPTWPTEPPPSAPAPE